MLNAPNIGVFAALHYISITLYDLLYVTVVCHLLSIIVGALLLLLSNLIQWYFLIGLLILWAAFLFGGFLFGDATDTSQRMPIWTRMASSAALVVAAFSWYAFTRHTAAGSYAFLVAAGMTFGLLGDLLLVGVLPGGRNVMAGIASFGIGHIFYITAMVRFASAAGLANPTHRWGTLIIWFLIALIGWYIVVYRGATSAGIELTIVHWIALPYALLLATTAGLAAGLALQDNRFIPLAVGAGLFLFSDLILAGDMFSGVSFRQIGDVIWLTYGLAQMLIVYSIGSVQSWFSR